MQKEKNVRSEEGLTGKRTGESEWRGRYKDVTLLYVCPCIIYEIDERYPLDATIYLLL